MKVCSNIQKRGLKAKCNVFPPRWRTHGSPPWVLQRTASSGKGLNIRTEVCLYSISENGGFYESWVAFEATWSSDIQNATLAKRPRPFPTTQTFRMTNDKRQSHSHHSTPHLFGTSIPLTEEKKKMQRIITPNYQVSFRF